MATGKVINSRGAYQYEKASVMKIKLSSPILVKKSLTVASAFVALASSVLGITGISLRDFFPQFCLVFNLFLAFALFGFFVLIIYIVFMLINCVCRRKITLTINKRKIEIIEGDLFKQDGWKVIPFTNRFDTKVDDIVISRNSLNGMFIDKYVGDMKKLRTVIRQEKRGRLRMEKDEKTRRYELGTIKRYDDDYLLLAFAEMNDSNEAHLTVASYVECLVRMWREISRVYASKPVNLPLLGSGITRFDNMRSKTEEELLKYLLFTFKVAGESSQVPVRIVLTRKTIRKINLYEIKEIGKTIDGRKAE